MLTKSLVMFERDTKSTYGPTITILQGSPHPHSKVNSVHIPSILYWYFSLFSLSRWVKPTSRETQERVRRRKSTKIFWFLCAEVIFLWEQWSETNSIMPGVFLHVLSFLPSDPQNSYSPKHLLSCWTTAKGKTVYKWQIKPYLSLSLSLPKVLEVKRTYVTTSKDINVDVTSKNAPKWRHWKAQDSVLLAGVVCQREQFHAVWFLSETPTSGIHRGAGGGSYVCRRSEQFMMSMRE